MHIRRVYYDFGNAWCTKSADKVNKNHFSCLSFELHLHILECVPGIFFCLTCSLPFKMCQRYTLSLSLSLSINAHTHKPIHGHIECNISIDSETYSISQFVSTHGAIFQVNCVCVQAKSGKLFEIKRRRMTNTIFVKASKVMCAQLHVCSKINLNIHSMSSTPDMSKHTYNVQVRVQVQTSVTTTFHLKFLLANTQ